MNKLWSARFWTLMLDSTIYPGCVILSGVLAVQGKIQVETFIAILGGYALLVKETRQKYFDRDDRTQTKETPDVKA